MYSKKKKSSYKEVLLERSILKRQALKIGPIRILVGSTTWAIVNVKTFLFRERRKWDAAKLPSVGRKETRSGARGRTIIIFIRRARRLRVYRYFV